MSRGGAGCEGPSLLLGCQDPRPWFLASACWFFEFSPQPLLLLPFFHLLLSIFLDFPRPPGLPFSPRESMGHSGLLQGLCSLTTVFKSCSGTRVGAGPSAAPRSPCPQSSPRAAVRRCDPGAHGSAHGSARPQHKVRAPPWSPSGGSCS